ncbi:hypothetical protein [Guptibacillus algicola]|uniref:hypothetical protein n=1 Tax=Guptibacillus algicola TaxID=225844 RepID=UPI001CD71D81|nr:hypothetical protein [Alkalihalobacillus algicola]MCA0989064.1 hypothetical protein [Alkalihalobacillus algicola]
MTEIFKKNIPKLLVVLVVFAGFLLYMNWSQNEQPTFQVSEEFQQVDTEKELMDEITSKLTRSELATDYELFTDVDYEKILMEDRRALRIEKAWFRQGILQLIYSIDLRQEDKKISDVPYLMFEDLTLKAGGKNHKLNLTKQETNWLVKGNVHNYRLFRGVNIRLTGSEGNFEEIKKVMENDTIDQIVIDQPEMIHGSYENKKTLEPMEIDVSLSTNPNEELESIALNQSTTLSDGRTIDWEALTLSIDNTKLSFQLKNTDRPLQGLKLRITKPNGEVFEDQVSVGSSKEKGHYEVNIREFQEFPHEFSIEVTALEFMEEGTPMTYTISKETIEQGLALDKGNSQSIEKKIGSKNGMGIFFEGLSNNNTYGGPNQDVLGISVGIEDAADKQFNTWFNYVTEGMQNLKYNVTGESDSAVYHYMRGPLIEITDQNGSIIEPHGSSLSPSPDKEVQNILIDREAFRNASEINLKISHFPLYESVESEKVTFTLTKSGGES